MLARLAAEPRGQQKKVLGFRVYRVYRVLDLGLGFKVLGFRVYRGLRVLEFSGCRVEGV